jgi:predicted alpha-1,6-mannanase (GH76 family)
MVTAHTTRCRIRVYKASRSDHQRTQLSTAAALVRRARSPPYTISPNAHEWLDGYYDDDLWWAQAWIRAYDVTRELRYLTLAEDIFLLVSRTWATHCFDGGIYWSWKKDYVNAIANELFFSTAAALAYRAEDENKEAFYVDWAVKSLQ